MTERDPKGVDCPVCGWECHTERGVANHIGKSHRWNKHSERNRMIQRMREKQLTIKEIIEITNLSPATVMLVVARLEAHPEIYTLMEDV